MVWCLLMIFSHAGLHSRVCQSQSLPKHQVIIFASHLNYDQYLAAYKEFLCIRCKFCHQHDNCVINMTVIINVAIAIVPFYHQRYIGLYSCEDGPGRPVYFWEYSQLLWSSAPDGNDWTDNFIIINMGVQELVLSSSDLVMMMIRPIHRSGAMTKI